MSQLLFTGLSAFPLTPYRSGELDEHSFTSLLGALERSAVDSIAVLGSTGSYMYLTDYQRDAVAHHAASAVVDKPLVVGVSDVSTAKVLRHIKVAEEVSATGVLVAPVSYQSLRADEVFYHFQAICESTELPVIVYDNPGLTHFAFDVDLYRRIASLPGVASLKIPATVVSGEHAVGIISRIRSAIPEEVSIGISGDGGGALGLAAGCDVWYSAVAGTFPIVGEKIIEPWLAGDNEGMLGVSAQYQRLWNLFERCGSSLRGIAALAAELGLVERECLPPPLLPLPMRYHSEIKKMAEELVLTEEKQQYC